MSEVVNPRDLLLRGTPTRLVQIVLPPNITIPALDALLPNAAQPPAPTGLSAEGALYDVNVRTNPPVFLQGHGYSHTKLYGKIYFGGALPVFADAALLTSFIGQLGSITVGPAVNMRIWAAWVTKDGVESLPAGGLNGVQAQTGEDAERLVAALTGPGKPFTIVNEPTILSDGTVVPAGTYTSSAFMQRFVAGRGQIGLLAVDDARIASASATKLTSGTIRVGTFIGSSNYISGQQGWAINGSGGAEFSGVTVRGTIFATSGQIGGCTITGGGIYSPNFSATAGWGFDVNGNAQFNQISLRGSIMGGAYTGYAWPPGAGTGFFLGPPGLLLGNPNIGRYFQATEAGDIYTPAFTVVGGLMTVYQLNVIDTLNIRGEAVTVSRFASSGSFAAAGTDWTTVLVSPTIDVGGSVIVISLYAALVPQVSTDTTGATTVTYPELRLLRNGATQITVTGPSIPDQPGGPAYYVMQLRTPSGAATGVEGRHLFLQGSKR